jgi:hypothetical protein
VGRLVGFSSRSLPSSTMGSWWRTVWVLWPALLDGVGCRSWMKVGGLVGAGVGALVGMDNRILGQRFGWIVSRRFGGVTGRSIGFRLGSGL